LDPKSLTLNPKSYTLHPETKVAGSILPCAITVLEKEQDMAGVVQFLVQGRGVGVQM